MEYTRSEVKYAIVKCLIAIVIICVCFLYLPYKWKVDNPLPMSDIQHMQLYDIYTEAGLNDRAEDELKAAENIKDARQKKVGQQMIATVAMLLGVVFILFVLLHIKKYIKIMGIMDKTNSNTYFEEKRWKRKRKF